MEMTFAQTIRESRNKKGWSVRDLAKKLDKTPGYISKIEARGEIPSLEMMIRLGKLLGLKPERLIEMAKAEKVETVSQAVQKKYDDGLALYRRSKRH